MMKTKQAKNQNHHLPERSSQFTQTTFPHNQGKQSPMWSTWEQEFQKEGRILPDQANSFCF